MPHHCRHCVPRHDCTHKAIVIKDRAESKKPSGNVVMIRPGFELRLPHDFFDHYKQKGSVFKLNYLRQNGQKVAVKWVTKSHDCNFRAHMAYLKTASEITASVISKFKALVDMKGWNIRVVKPLVPDGAKEISLEPYVSNLEKFNTNTFWETGPSRTYHKLVLALSHFSYVASKGKYVLANLCGGVDEDKRIVTLLPPTVVSREEGKYGCMDLGTADKFFKYHSCTSFCKDMPRQHSGRKKNAHVRFIEL